MAAANLLNSLLEGDNSTAVVAPTTCKQKSTTMEISWEDVAKTDNAKNDDTAQMMLGAGGGVKDWPDFSDEESG